MANSKKGIDISNGYYLVKFPSGEDRTQVLTEVPWIIASNYLSLQ